MSPQLLRIVSLAAGCGYFVTIPWHPFPGTIALKGIAVAALAWLAFQSPIEGGARRLLTAALALSALGDALLEADPSNFAFGLAAFLLAHLCYIQLFFSQRRKGDRLGGARIAAAIALLLFSIGFSIWLMPFLGEMGLPVVAYIGALTAMVFAAVAWRAQRSDFVVFGAFLFLVSDAALGAAKFRGPVPLRDWIVWGSYYAAQYLITTGVLRELRR